MWLRFTELARRVVFEAHEAAVRIGAEGVQALHLLLAVLEISREEQDCLIEKLGVNPDEINREIEAIAIEMAGEPAIPFSLTDDAKQAIDFSYAEAKNLEHKTITHGHLLLGVLRTSPEAMGAFERKGADLNAVRQACIELQKNLPTR